MRDWIREVDVVLLVGTRTNDNGTYGWTLFVSNGASLPRTVVFDVITDPFAYPPATDWDSSQHLHKALGAPPPRAGIMAIDDVDDFQQKIADIRADCRYAFELMRAPNFALQSRNKFAAGGAVSG